MPDRRRVVIPDGMDGERADSGLARILGIPRTKVELLIEAKSVSKNRNKLVVKSDRLKAGEIIDIEFLEQDDALTIHPSIIPDLRIIYQDEDIVVVEKPAGIAAHPSLGWQGSSVLDGLAGLGITITTSGAAERQGVVQRLDVGTSGLMVVAKSEIAYSKLKDDFRYRRVKKIYHALVQGRMDPFKGTIDAPIARHPKDDWKFAVMEGGRESVTHYDTLEAFAAASLLEIELETGRTHQIRVHVSALKHPCVGDITYGADPKLADFLGLERQFLHATRLAFVHPVSRGELEFESGYPSDLAHALELLQA